MMMGDSLASPEGQTGEKATGPALVFPEAPVAMDDRSLDGALKIYSPSY
jgi:hypothetical protein